MLYYYYNEKIKTSGRFAHHGKNHGQKEKIGSKSQDISRSSINSNSKSDLLFLEGISMTP
ncbi:hypothetical protein NEF87_003881 [Candidatus Lokiarchaeum ossiferum]|uniref:Uncharacterized protein n=1 Tax=Candidatus Lokiarchaeum ossiferum TaxID=2951803 RepID=A0ABY6HYD8_9ARCH|nr:hypothetical protein NEF87_003881 [Candidatus Lokiarchaeum sp. B-35]